MSCISPLQLAGVPQCVMERFQLSSASAFVHWMLHQIVCNSLIYWPFFCLVGGIDAISFGSLKSLLLAAASRLGLTFLKHNRINVAT